MTKKGILKEIISTKIIAIIRLASSKSVYYSAMALSEGGVNAIEVTMGTPNALKEIEKLSKQAGILVSVTTLSCDDYMLSYENINPKNNHPST